MSLKVSVLIPTLGREKEVISTVRALEDQSILPYEVVVVDQNQPELPGLTRFLASAPRVKHLRFQTKGVALNYNRALAAASGDIVLFLDDDVELGRRLVECHLRHYLEDSGVGGVAGRVEQPSGDLDPGGIRHIGRYHSWSGLISANFNATRSAWVEIAPGGNMSFRREALLAEEGFDLGFGGNGYFFETDMSLRIHRAGWRIAFDPEASLVHLMAPSGGARIGDKAIHTHFFAKNGLRLARRHSPWFFALGAGLRMAAYVFLKAAYNRDPQILAHGTRGVWEGMRQSLDRIGISSEAQIRPD